MSPVAICLPSVSQISLPLLAVEETSGVMDIPPSLLTVVLESRPPHGSECSLCVWLLHMGPMAVHTHASAFCRSPHSVCLFPIYNLFLPLCKAPGWAWRSRNCLQVVLQASEPASAVPMQ